MRKLTSLVAALLLSVAAFAQAPQGFSYQAVVRDAQNAIVANQTVDVTLTLKAEIKSIPVQTYTEKHSVKTNANGLLTLVVGQGESSQKFSDFKWNLPEAIYNLETVTPYGTGTTQLLSVPYALYAEQAGNIDYAKLLSSLNVNDLSTILGLADYLKQADIQELLSTYALKTEIPTDVNLSAYAKTADVDSIYAKKTDIPTAVNLSGYATKDTLNNFALKSSVSNDYVTKETFENYVLSGGSTESVDLTVYAKTADVAATYATKVKLNDTLNVYAKTADVAATYATKAKLNDTLNVYAKTADVASTYATQSSLKTVATTGSYNDLTDRPTKVSDLTADKIGDMPMATVNVTVTTEDDVVATVSFLGRELTSGTTSFRIPAYSPVFLSVSLSKYSEGNRNYSYTVKINGKPFDPVTGYYYAIYPSNPQNLKIVGVPGTRTPDTEEILSGDYYGTFSGYDLRVVKTPIYKTGSGKSLEIPAHWFKNEFSAGHAPVVTDAERNMVNQVVGPFPNAENTIEITVRHIDIVN